MDYELTRFIFQRALGFIYLIGFWIAFNQGPALIGRKGLLPAPFKLKLVSFWNSPSLFYLHFSDRALKLVAAFGMALSAFVLTGCSDSWGLAVSVVTWFTLWVLYLSIVNVGQDFYGFGWEMLLLEAGFLAIFLGDRGTPVFVPLIFFYRWLLFRLMFGAGMIKWRGDSCWRDGTCMYYHYETQPLPNPLSRFFHFLPKPLHRFSVWVNHLVEIPLPFLYFIPGMISAWAGIISVAFMGILIISGNFSWLNCITIVLCLLLGNDAFYMSWGFADIPTPAESSLWFYFIAPVLLYLAYRSYFPFRNLFGEGQVMNRSFDPLHLVNTYGAFGTITRDRPEIIFMGTTDAEITEETEWKEYEFKGKPGSIGRKPRQVTPYHLKLDWQLWFAAMGDYRFYPWTLNLAAKFLKAEPLILKMIAHDPFHGQRPQWVKADVYMYRYAVPPSKNTWERMYSHGYLPPLSLQNEALLELLQHEGWDAE